VKQTGRVKVGSSHFAGGEGDFWTYEPVRDSDGRIDIALSLMEYEHLAQLHLKRDGLLRWMPRTRGRLVGPQVTALRVNLEVENQRNGF
jgi:hypothetical protein